MPTKEEARKHPQRHILTSALGIKKKPKMEAFLSDIQPNDLFLLSSDGLHDALDEDQILKIILSDEKKPLYRLGLTLVLKANLASGRDNITVVLLAFGNHP